MNNFFKDKFIIITFTILLISLPVGISSVKVFCKPFKNEPKIQHIQQPELKEARIRLLKYKTMIAYQNILHR